MPSTPTLDTIIRENAGQWTATVLRGRRKLYVTPATKTRDAAEILAEQFKKELRP